MADAGANAYLELFEMLKKEGRNERDKIAGLIWVRLTFLLKSRSVISLSVGELFEIFENIILNPLSIDERKDMEVTAGENDENEIGDFWASSVYLSKLILDDDEQYLGYLLDRYISCIERRRVDVSSVIQSEAESIMTSRLNLRSSQDGRSEKLADYVRQALNA